MRKCVVCNTSVGQNAGTNRHPACEECVNNGAYQTFINKVNLEETEDRLRTIKDHRGKRNIFVKR